MTQLTDRVGDEIQGVTPADSDDLSFADALREKLELPASQPEGSDDAAARPAESSEPDEASPEQPSSPRQPVQERRLEQLRAEELREMVTSERTKHGTELQSVRDELDALRKEHDTLVVSQNDTTHQALASFGSDDQYAALARKVQAAKDLDQDPSYYLSDEEMRSFEQMHSQRLHGAAMFRLATERIDDARWGQVESRIEKLGLDPKKVTKGIETGALMDHVAAATEARVREAVKDEIAEAKADADSARSQLAGRAKGVSVTGRYSGDGEPMRNTRDSAQNRRDDDGDDDLIAGLRERDRSSRRGLARL